MAKICTTLSKGRQVLSSAFWGLPLRTSICSISQGMHGLDASVTSPAEELRDTWTVQEISRGVKMILLVRVTASRKA